MWTTCRYMWRVSETSYSRRWGLLPLFSWSILLIPYILSLNRCKSPTPPSRSSSQAQPTTPILCGSGKSQYGTSWSTCGCLWLGSGGFIAQATQRRWEPWDSTRIIQQKSIHGGRYHTAFALSSWVRSLKSGLCICTQLAASQATPQTHCTCFFGSSSFHFGGMDISTGSTVSCTNGIRSIFQTSEIGCTRTATICITRVEILSHGVESPCIHLKDSSTKQVHLFPASSSITQL